ncbi:MAG: HNH endonuclease [Candidatus Acidiferrum sp.]
MPRPADYAEYLRSPHWRKTRLRVLARARGKCEACHRRRAREVHHLTYIHIGEERLDELLALCPNCHDMAHSDRVEDRACFASLVNKTHRLLYGAPAAREK